MKIILTVLVSVFSVGALACPNLGGSFTCVDQDGEQFSETIIQTVNADGVTEYEFSEGDTFVTDGVKRTEAIDGGTVTHSSVCAGKVLNFDIFMNATSDGFTADVKGTSTETATGYKIDGTAVITYGGNRNSQPLSTVCTRL